MKCKYNKELLSLKLVLFTYYGAAACILPYLTVHMRQIGITVEETAIIYAILPIVGFLGPPVAGFLADRLGRYQPVLIGCLVAVALFHTALLAIPHVSTEEAPAEALLMRDPEGASSSSLLVRRCSEDFACPEAVDLTEIEFGLDACHSDCWSARTGNGQLTTSSNDSSKPSDASTASFSDLDLVAGDAQWCHYDVRNVSIASDRTFWPDMADAGHCVVTCSLNTSALLTNGSSDGRRFPVCSELIGNHPLTFSTYFLLRIVGGVFLSTAFTLMDATCFAMIGKCDGDYAKQKLWSILASAIFSPITGFLIDHVSTHTKGYADYSPAFYVFDVLIICTILLSFRISIELDNANDKMIHNLKTLLKNMEVIAFLLMIFVLGCMWGFLETFLFWYMLDLHSPKYLLGLTVTIGAGFSIPVMFCAGKILKKTGNIPLLICAFGFYAVRMVGYSFIYNPWWSLAFESLEVITINLMWVAAATYGNSIAPQGLIATMQGTMGGIHYGIGRGAGSFVGGLLMQNFGARKTFRIMGLISSIACFCTLIYYFSYFRRSKLGSIIGYPATLDVDPTRDNVDYREGSARTTNGGIKNRDNSQLQQMLKSEENEEESGL